MATNTWNLCVVWRGREWSRQSGRSEWKRGRPGHRRITKLLKASALDALLDDSVMFAKKLRDMGQPVSLTVVEELPHGFLSLSQLAKETEVAAEICVEKIRKIFQQETQMPALREQPKLQKTYPSTNLSG